VQNLNTKLPEGQERRDDQAFAAGGAGAPAPRLGRRELNPADALPPTRRCARVHVQTADEQTRRPGQRQPGAIEELAEHQRPGAHDYELMTKGASIAFWIESRTCAASTATSRASVLQNKGQYDQKTPHGHAAVDPFESAVARLKNTQIARPARLLRLHDDRARVGDGPLERRATDGVPALESESVAFSGAR